MSNHAYIHIGDLQNSFTLIDGCMANQIIWWQVRSQWWGRGCSSHKKFSAIGSYNNRASYISIYFQASFYPFSPQTRARKIWTGLFLSYMIINLSFGTTIFFKLWSFSLHHQHPVMPYMLYERHREFIVACTNNSLLCTKEKICVSLANSHVVICCFSIKLLFFF